MRADRLLSLILLLQNRGRMTARELAAELEVSVRTVHRDIEALGASGVPVVAERGPLGGFRLVDGYRTRLTGLSDAEAGALVLTGVPRAARELGLGALLATARLKVRAALPAEPAERARLVEERFHLDAPAWFREGDAVPHLETVALAVWERRVLHAHYRRWRGEVHRELLPLGMVLKGGVWYLVASARTDAAPGSGPDTGAAPVSGAPVTTAGGPGSGDDPGPDPVRTYRVSRLLSAEACEETFERPAGFDLAAHWERSSRRLEEALRPTTAELRISPRARRLLPMRFGAVAVEALEGAGPPDGEGWIRVAMRVETTTVAVGDLLSLGAEAEVIGPPELREAVAREAEVTARRYTSPR
ncbi:helix-turn-helix transcriptional regulator, partial [Streptomyces alkaliphilus]|uniref:helix-turn-helix transcriptional regulator n=1 Tax=Streptomyces alkaliphilus TaxID=1472722 RepID=UPI00117D2A90|nr:WYL domain-containing protein [Streptomyces alkaliphilus]